MLRSSLIVVEASSFLEALPSTEQLRTRILQASMQTASYVWRTVVLPSAGFPARLFELLANPSPAVAARMLETKRCQRDDFSHFILSAFASPEELTSSACLNVLAIAATAVRTTTYGTERAHSRNTRLMRNRVHTKPIDLHTIAMSHTGRAGPRWLLEDAKAKLIKKGKGRGRPKKRQAEAPLAGQPARRRRGGGGPWRAFLHVRFPKQQFTREGLRAAKAEYAHLTPRERSFYDELGQQGPLACVHRTASQVLQNQRRFFHNVAS